MNNYALIMAGGSGTRLWPLTRKDKPKQNHSFLDYGLTLDKLIESITTLIPKERIFITVGDAQLKRVKEIFPYPERILLQPADRNNGPAILQAAMAINDPEGILTILPSDQIIRDIEAFRGAVNQSVHISKQLASWCTIGTKPLYPSSGFGYIQVRQGETAALYVDRFLEKPNVALAKKMMEDAQILWNTGIYTTPIAVLIEDYRRYLPRIYRQLTKVAPDTDSFIQAYGRTDSISVDHGIIERLARLFCVKSSHEWMDVGTFEFIDHFFPSDSNGNAAIGSAISINSRNNTVYTENATVVTFGVEDLLIIDSDDVILVCPKSEAQRIRDLVNTLKKTDHKDLT